jgi:hypothetical protein
MVMECLQSQLARLTLYAKTVYIMYQSVLNFLVFVQNLKYQLFLQEHLNQNVDLPENFSKHIRVFTTQKILEISK